jgi:hypothetical protein
MSINEIERLFRDRHRATPAARSQDLGAALLDEYRLEPHERAVILDKDYGALYGLGVHPMAVLFFSQDNEEPMASYLAAIGAAQERVDQLATLFTKASVDSTDQAG